MAKIVLILGGARSGKSRFAKELAERIGGRDVLFVATAEAVDEEMRRRIDLHRQSRPKSWKSHEQARHVGQWLGRAGKSQRVVVLDCLTLLVSNVLLEFSEELDVEQVERAVQAEVESLLEACSRRDGTVIIVSGEVGHGVVPAHPLGRVFRDLLGFANQSIGRQAAVVYLMVAGLPVDISSHASSLDQAAALCGAVAVPRSPKRKQTRRKRSK